jgi:FKBP-type peptidyl-prolyl cis-trans isomerase SlyD
MKIGKNAVVGIDFVLKGDDGVVIDSSEGRQPLYYLHGYRNIVAGLEDALLGREVGEEVTVTVPPEKGYGSRKPELEFEIPLAQLPPGMLPQKGMRLNMSAQGRGQMACTITKVKLKSVMVDANHELVDKTLHFSVTVRAVRKPNKEELAHGHAHAPGHHH